MGIESQNSWEQPRVDTGNALTDFATGVWNGVRMPVDGARQLAGQDVNVYYGHGIPENAGMLTGEALLYVGGTALASRIPGAGRFAPMVVGGALGFLMPTQGDQDMSTRFKRGALAAATVGTFQHAPELFGKLGVQNNFARLALANASAGVLYAQGDSLMTTGRPAGLMDTAMTAGTFTVAGALLHGLGAPARRFGLGTSDVTKQIGAVPFSLASHSMTEMGLSNPKPEYKEPEVVNADQIGKLSPGDYRVKMQSQGQEREYDIHIPKGYDPSKPLALTVVLDGVTPNIHGVMSRESQFNKYADDNNVAVIYPYAKNGHGAPLTGDVRSWNTKGTGLTNYDSSYDDVQFLDDVLQDAKKHVNLDSTRVTGTGFSEGGMMLQKYASLRPKLFNGIAAIHGSLNGTEQLPTNPADAPNVMVIHSTSDYMLPYDGGKGLMTVTMANASDSKPYTQANAWAKANGVDSSTRESNQMFTKTEYKKDGDTRVVEYVIKGGNHAWDGSGTGGWPLVGKPLRRDQFDTSAVVWKFLRDADIKRSLEPAQKAS